MTAAPVDHRWEPGRTRSRRRRLHRYDQFPSARVAAAAYEPAAPRFRGDRLRQPPWYRTKPAAVALTAAVIAAVVGGGWLILRSPAPAVEQATTEVTERTAGTVKARPTAVSVPNPAPVVAPPPPPSPAAGRAVVLAAATAILGAAVHRAGPGTEATGRRDTGADERGSGAEAGSRQQLQHPRRRARRETASPRLLRVLLTRFDEST